MCSRLISLKLQIDLLHYPNPGTYIDAQEAMYDKMNSAPTYGTKGNAFNI